MSPSNSITLTLRLLIGLVFVVAGVLKLPDLQGFSDSVSSFEILPNSLITLWAMTLPPLEITIGVMLVTGHRCQLAAFSAFFLSTLFCLALGQALFRGLNINCGCFGSEDQTHWEEGISLFRDLALMAATLWLYLRFISENSRSLSL